MEFNEHLNGTVTGAGALIEAIATKKLRGAVSVRSLQEIHTSREKVIGVK
ncbi:MAG: hypothetical protein H0X72_00510 [Acidobacteria bacterium]|nr:hypothetical protein [Acidobacteriota bacterium]